MNEVPIVREESIKSFSSQIFISGLISGIILFLVSLLSNDFRTSLIFGLFGIILGIIIPFMIFVFEEYYTRKKIIKGLNSSRYSFLDENNFILHPDLYFEGKYKDFWFRVIPMTKRQKREKELKYDIIEAFYDFSSDEFDGKKEQDMSGKYFIGELNFLNCCVGFIPKDWTNPNFKDNFDSIVNIFNRENLKPISKDEWDSIYGKRIEEQKINEERARTKLILKIGKLEIKHIKQK